MKITQRHLRYERNEQEMNQVISLLIYWHLEMFSLPDSTDI